MAIAYPLTLNPTSYGGANEDKVFTPVHLGTTKVISRVAGDFPTVDYTLTISHADSKVSGVTVDRHLVRLDLTETDTVLGSVTASVYLVAAIPRGQTAISDQELLDLKGRLLALVQGSGNWDAILGSELLG
jgi:hypothetical protein